MQVVDLQNIEHLSVADRDYLSSVFETLLEVCFCYGLNKGPYISKLKTKFIRYWGDLVSLDPLWNHVEKDVNGKTIVGSYNVKCLMTLTKYKMCAFFSHMTHTELPKCPVYWVKDDPSVLIGGVINRWIRHFEKMAWGTHGGEASDFIALTHKQFLFSFCQAVKMSKRQMPRADIPMVWRSMVGTYQKLTTAPVVPPLPDPFLLPTELFYESRVAEDGTESTYVELLKYYTRVMMSGLDMSKLHSLKMHPFAPSRSATFIHSRSEFGQAGEIALFGGTGNVAEVFGKIDVACNWSADFLSATMTCEVNLARARAAYNYSMSHCFDGYRAQCREYMPDTADGEFCYRPVSILAPIPEPLKVRNVSKGPGEVAEFLKPDQDAMIGHLGLYNCCCVGRKESPQEMRRALGGTISDDEYYLSVDYEDSTNNLRREFSKIISEEIFTCCNVDPIAQVMWAETLYGGSVTLPSVPKGDLRDCSFPNELMEQINQCKPARMKRGQLMGNIVSFPILCLANGFCLWLSRMVSTGTYRDPRYEKYVVNGDDGVVRVNQAGYDFWKLLSSWMGFPPSIGKVYLSRDFFDFNSKFFSVVENPCSLRGFEFLGRPKGVIHWFDEPDDILIVQIPFCYVSLCHGKSRTGTNRDITELMGLDRGLSIGALQENFLSQAPKETHARMMSLFYTHLLYRSDIYAKIKGLAWYLPVCVGGLGLKPLLQEEYEKISVGGGRAFWAAQPRKCDFSIGSPPEYLKCTRRSSEGVEKIMACGPSGLDLRLARYIGKRLAYHENDLVKQDEVVLPVKPKLQPNFNLTPPCPLLNFTFDEPEDYDSSAESVWSFWGNIDRFRKELLRKKGFVKSQEYEARIVSQWMSQWRKFWRQVKAQNDCTEGFVNIYGLRSESPIVIRDTCTDDEVQSIVLHCKSVVDYGREVPFIIDWWVRSNVLSIKRMPVFWPLLTLLI